MMRNLIANWVISTLALLLSVWALRGVTITHWYHALWLAPLLGLINVIVGALARFLSWFATPVNLLTLGCFGFILSFFGYVVAIYFFAQVETIPLRIAGVPWAVAMAVMMALFSTLLNMLLPGKGSHKRR